MHPDRRRHVRHQITKPIKVRSIETGRYYSGQTMDVSAGGAMVELGQRGVLVAGQIVHLGIAWERSDMLLSSQELVEARVLRCVGHNDVQKLALQFREAQSLRATA